MRIFFPCTQNFTITFPHTNFFFFSPLAGKRKGANSSGWNLLKVKDVKIDLTPTMLRNQTRFPDKKSHRFCLDIPFKKKYQYPDQDQDLTSF